MEMRATEDVGIGEDLTPPLPPLASALHDSALTSYCSACFSNLPPHPFTPNFPQNSCYHASAPLYCSPNCSSIDSPLHFSSAEPYLLPLFTPPCSTWSNSSDLRLSLRLLHKFQNLPAKCCYHVEVKENPVKKIERIAGLMTNRENLVFGENKNLFHCGDEIRGNCEDLIDNYENVLERIRQGAKMIAKARRMCVQENEEVEDFELEEMVLCLVMTNAVEVEDKSGRSIGIAVYDTAFSWINHSCSPNACYWFSMGWDGNEQPPLRITPAARDANGLIMEGDSKYQLSEGTGYGPGVIVRSVKAINIGEEVTIAYTDLLQPKEMRLAELWSKYGFGCCCKRCAAVPATYVDYALQALSAHCTNEDVNEIEKLMQYLDDAINDYLSLGDPKSCCKKLENLLSHGKLSDEIWQLREAKPLQTVNVHPFHHLSLNAYTTLASAYKVQASDLLALDDKGERHKLEALNMHKTSSAYSLLLAGVVHHLFMFEPALVTTVSNFWISAGESLLILARTPLWDSFLNLGSVHFDLNLKCNDCCLADTLGKNQFEGTKSRLHNCIVNITMKVWRMLSSESSFLKSIHNPINFSWLSSPEEYSQSEGEGRNDQVRMDFFLLSIHCLRYGALLSSICYGLSTEMNYNRILYSLKEPFEL